MEPEIVTRHLQGTSELTLLAKVKPGLIDTLDTRTYMTRLRAMLQTLHTLRLTSREYSMVRTFSDSTDRIRTITDLRMAILEPEQKLLLSVSFDRPWEPYLRIIWREVGTQLDTIFCNCEGYPISFDSSFATYGAWIRQARTNTRFFYNPSSATFDDAQFMRQTDRLVSDVPAVDMETAKVVASDPEEMAKQISKANPAYTVKQGMQALSVIYRLADVYEPGTTDGDILLRASRELLRELMPAFNLLPPGAQGLIRARFKAQFDWFESPAAQVPAPVPPAKEPPNTDDVQGGILAPYDKVTHGCVLLLSVDDPKKAADFLQSLRKMLSTQANVPGLDPAKEPFVNVAFTPEGLRALGLSKREMSAFPHDFTEGMQERAGLLGDVRGNHPRNWSLPARNWPASGPGAPPTGALVQLSTVHVVVQMSMQSDDPGFELIGPLRTWIEKLMAEHPSVRLLSVQPMRRYIDPTAGNKVREHFGFVDGFSQPQVGTPPNAPAWSNLVSKGELLLGYANDRGDPPMRNAWCDNGTFLVMRKLRQDVDALNKAIATMSGMPAADVKAKLMGRTPDGDPIEAPGSVNQFRYNSADASRCPFAAHIRRANPRTDNKQDPHGVFRPTVPRIMRRGMSYGPQFTPATADAERGILFMAYNASISEQFEAVQRWISGGNSTGVLSEHRDPFMGVPQLGEARTFRFPDGAGVARVKLDDAAARAPKPIVKVEWGMYLFVPSATALEKLERKARSYAPPLYTRPVNMPTKRVADGERIIEELLAKEKLAKTKKQKAAVVGLWKSVLEDSHARAYGDSEAVWAAIRARGGVLRTLYGVVVAEKDLVMKVLTNRANYSVCGYVPRLNKSIGQMYLGMDAGPAYVAESTPTNAAIYAVSEQDAFDLARLKAAEFINNLVQVTKMLSAGAPTWELTLDVKEVSDYALAKLCDEWFSINDAGSFKAGGSPWDWKPKDPPFYPGHFTAPSRMVFQPNPGKEAIRIGNLRGRALRKAMTAMIQKHRDDKTVPAGRIVNPIFLAFAARPTDMVARTILGTLIGFLPTVEGNFRATLNEWLDERMFWDLQNAYLSDPRSGAQAYLKAVDILRVPLMHTMQFRPAPEVSWRTAIKAHKLAGVQVKAKETVAVSLVSATQEDLAAGKTGVCPVFGGKRTDPQPATLPMHACPGYKIGMGVLLGMLAALMEAGPLRPTPAPLTVSLGGRMPPPPAPQP